MKKYTAFYLISILCFVKDGIDKKHSSGISFRKKLNYSIAVNGLFVVNVYQTQQSVRADSLSVVMAVRDPLTSFSQSTRSLSTEVTEGDI